MRIQSLTVFATCLILGQFVWAGQDINYEATDSSFKLMSHLVENDGNIKTSELNLGVFQVGFINVRGGCTGTLISSEGHVLTARHCLEDSLADSEIIRRKKEPTMTPFFDVNDDKVKVIAFNNDFIYKTLQLPAMIDSSVTYFSIYAMGPGMLGPRLSDDLTDQAVIQFHNNLSNQGYSSGGDFAIVQIPSLKGQRCYKLSSAPIAEGDDIHVIAFSGTSVEHGDDWPKKFSSKILFKVPDEGFTGFGHFFPKGSFLAGGDVDGGNSGSAALNAKNEVVGVLRSGISATDETGQDVYRPEFVSMQRILELIPEAKRQQLLKLNKNCDR